MATKKQIIETISAVRSGAIPQVEGEKRGNGVLGLENGKVQGRFCLEDRSYVPCEVTRLDDGKVHLAIFTSEKRDASHDITLSQHDLAMERGARAYSGIDPKAKANVSLYRVPLEGGLGFGIHIHAPRGVDGDTPF